MSPTSGYIPAYSMATTEIPVNEFVRSQKGIDAVNKELEAMTTKSFGGMRPRLIKMTPEEAAKYSDPKSMAHKTMLKLRLTCSEKRATPEELDADPNAVGASKARLVAQDFKRGRHENPEDTYAPVPEAAIFRLMVAAHSLEDWEISTTDVKNAYLQGWAFPYVRTKPKDKQWIAVRYLCPLTGIWEYLWMTGEIYGRQPAGHNWHDTFAEKQASIGMVECKNAKSVYVSSDGLVKQATHVDDPITFTRRMDVLNEMIKKSVKDKYYQELSGLLELKEQVTLSRTQDMDYLSTRISVSPEEEVCLSNAKFMFELITRKGMIGCNPTKTPITKEMLKLAAHEAELGLFLDEAGKTEYQADVGALNWAAQIFCPKLAPAVSLLGKRSAAPTTSGPAMIKQAIRWIAGNLDACLKTDKSNKEGIKWYCDSDLAGLYAVDGEKRSRMGILGTYNGMPFYWASSWIKATCNSSAEAEVYALSECTRMAVHFKWVCQELHIETPEQVPIYCDATAAIGFFKNLGGQTQSKLKHIDLRAQWVQEMRDSAGNIKLEHIPGVDNPANFFTKVLGPIEFARESTHLMGTVELPQAMVELNQQKKSANPKSKTVFQPGGMEISVTAARELQGDSTNSGEAAHELTENLGQLKTNRRMHLGFDSAGGQSDPEVND
jgi:hypothetical protein